MCVMCYVMLGTGEGREEGWRGSPGTQTIRNYHNNNNTTNTEHWVCLSPSPPVSLVVATLNLITLSSERDLLMLFYHFKR